MSDCIQIILESIMSEPAVVCAVARPEPGEYAPYYDRYISLVPGTDILGTLERRGYRLVTISALLADSTAPTLTYRPTSPSE